MGYIMIGVMEYKMRPFGPFNIWIVLHTAFWTLTSLILTISMFFSKNNRDAFLKKLSGIKERDEREVQIVGKALKSSYLTTMTILLFLLLISLFNVRVFKKSVHNVEQGQPRGAVILSIGFKVLNSEAAIVTQKEGYDLYFDLNVIPISPSTLILLLMLWQIVSYRFVAWRLSKVPDCPNSG
jgi:hypothetical protein